MVDEEKLELPKEFEKLTPEERLKRLKQLQEALEEKKKKEIEEKEKQLKELVEKTDKDLVRKRKQIIKEQERIQQLFKQQQKEIESLEEIAQSAPSKQEEEYVLPPPIQSMYNAAKYKPVQDLYQELSSMVERVQNKGYISPEEFERTRTIGYALSNKQEKIKEGIYTPQDEAVAMIDASRKKLHALQSMYRM
ncbi:MAG: hypothetical protein QW331_00630 [Candidatus Woesearchaeota archaeon]